MRDKAVFNVASDQAILPEDVRWAILEDAGVYDSRAEWEADTPTEVQEPITDLALVYGPPKRKIAFHEDASIDDILGWYLNE